MYKAKRKEVMIKLAEQNKNISAISQDVPISRSYLSQILLGKSHPSELMAIKIANALNCDLEMVFEIEKEA